MKSRSCKNKGYRASIAVRDMFRELSRGWLKDGDIVSTPGGVPGRDIQFSPQAERFFPYAIEVKNVEALNVREAFRQAVSHVRRDGEVPVLFHTKNRDEMLVTMRAKDFLAIGIRKPQNNTHAGCDEGNAQRLQEPSEEKGD